jgi:hypothetical protein
MVERAKQIGAHQGRGDREHVLNYQHQIPVCFRGKVVFLFTDDRDSEGGRYYHYIYWAPNSRWAGHWRFLPEDGFYPSSRVLRRKAVKKI